MTDPWLKLPLAEYEAHMSLPEVAQAALLGNVFAELLKAYAPCSVAVLGCAGGNGLERISPELTKRVVGVDLNAAYVGACRARFEDRIPGLELHVNDIEKDGLAFAPVELVYAALIFEYVDVGIAMQRIRPMLLAGGTLATVVQLPSSNAAAVTPSPFERVQAFSPVMRLVSAEELQALAAAQGLEQTGSRLVLSRVGKEFRVQTFLATERVTGRRKNP